MGNKTDQLMTLFEQWMAEQDREPSYSWARTRGGKNITKSHFRKDGIIDEETFSAEKRKVLFISNEANDDEYSAKMIVNPSSVADYRRYYETGHDDWLGKMRERTSALYKVIAGIGIDEMPDSDAALHYAVMDINKRGGGAQVRSAAHIEAYCEYYKKYIRREIEIIDPDVVVWIGTKTYDMELPAKYLGAIRSGDKRYFVIGRKEIPILRMWHTSFYQGKIDPLPGYSNRIIGKLCAKCKEEMNRYELV